MQVGIHGRELKTANPVLVENVLQALHHHDARIWVSSEFLKNNQSVNFSPYRISPFDLGDDLGCLDVFISLGGDGSLLESVTYIGCHEIPVLGINAGRMGFLSTIGSEEINKAIKVLFAGNYRIESRTMLMLTSNSMLFDTINFALNDITVFKKGTTSMINIRVYVNDKLLNSYWSDGIIVSTPTGSTGYSLSCGGPLVYPYSKNFIITPVSPHNLTVRPIVVPDDSDITLHTMGNHKKNLLSLDSRYGSVDNPIELYIKKHKYTTRLIQMSDQYYFKTLRQKLNWGLDLRN